MKRLVKEYKGEVIILLTFITFLLVNSIIDKISMFQIGGFFLILVAVILRILIFNKQPKQNAPYHSIKKEYSK